MRVPYIRFWLNDFYDATNHLDPDVQNTYHAMIDKACMTGRGSLPNDERAIRLMLRMPAQRWAKRRALVMPFWFVGEDGRLHNKRLDAEWANVTQRFNGKKVSIAENAEKKVPLSPDPNITFLNEERGLCELRNVNHREAKNPANTTRARAQATEAGKISALRQRDLPAVETEVQPAAPLGVRAHAPRPAPNGGSGPGYTLNYPNGDYPPWVLPPKNGD